MNLKILSIITGTLIIVTIFLFIFTGSPSKSPGVTPTSTPSANLSPVPTADLQQPPAPGKAKLTGSICLPESTPPAGFILVAEQLPSRQRITKYIPGPFDGDTPFALEVAPGTYQVYTEAPNRTKIGLYSQYAVCRGTPGCVDHDLLEINSEADKIVSNIDVCDYQWSQPQTSPSSSSIPTISTPISF